MFRVTLKPLVKRLFEFKIGRLDSMNGGEFKNLIKRTPAFALVLTLLLFLSLPQTLRAVPNGGYSHPEIIIQPGELKTLIEKKRFRYPDHRRPRET